MSYRVVKAMVIAKDQGGFNRNYYFGAVIPWLSEAQAKHFLSHNLVEVIDEPGKHEAPAATPKAAPASVEIAGKPPRAANHEAWVKYAVSQGLSESEAKGKSKQELIEALG